MSAGQWMRASDHDRDRIAAVLREAYAQGCLDTQELHERTTAAYSAKTLGALEGLTADLPALTGASLPSEIVVARRMPRNARWLIWTFLLVLAAGLAGRVFPVAVWVAGVLASLALALPFARLPGRSPEGHGRCRGRDEDLYRSMLAFRRCPDSRQATLRATSRFAARPQASWPMRLITDIEVPPLVLIKDPIPNGPWCSFLGTGGPPASIAGSAS